MIVSPFFVLLIVSPLTREAVMPKTMTGWLMFAASVLIVVVVVKRVPQINQFVGL